MSWDQKPSWISYAIGEPSWSFESDYEPMFGYGKDLE